MQDILGLAKVQETYIGPSGNPGNFKKIIEKYFEACKTFQDLPKFKKVILDHLAIQETLKNHRKIFWSLQDIPGLAKVQESYIGPSGKQGDFEKS